MGGGGSRVSRCLEMGGHLGGGQGGGIDSDVGEVAAVLVVAPEGGVGQRHGGAEGVEGAGEGRGADLLAVEIDGDGGPVERYVEEVPGAVVDGPGGGEREVVGPAVNGDVRRAQSDDESLVGAGRTPGDQGLAAVAVGGLHPRLDRARRVRLGEGGRPAADARTAGGVAGRRRRVRSQRSRLAQALLTGVGPVGRGARRVGHHRAAGISQPVENRRGLGQDRTHVGGLGPGGRDRRRGGGRTRAAGALRRHREGGRRPRCQPCHRGRGGRAVSGHRVTHLGAGRLAHHIGGDGAAVAVGGCPGDGGLIGAGGGKGRSRGGGNGAGRGGTGRGGRQPTTLGGGQRRYARAGLAAEGPDAR